MRSSFTATWPLVLSMVHAFANGLPIPPHKDTAEPAAPALAAPPPPPPVLISQDTGVAAELACVFRTALRKAGYAADVLRRKGGRYGGGDVVNDGEALQGQLHYLRRRGGEVDSPRTEGVTGHGDSVSGSQEGIAEDLGRLLRKLVPFYPAVFTLPSVAIGVGLMLVSFVAIWCGFVCRDALGKGRWLRWGAREGRSRLRGEEPVNWDLREKGEELLDERQGGYGEERYRDEKAGFDEERYRDEYVSLMFEDIEDIEDVEESESAVDLVESMVAAAGVRH
ncbi:predicted protein [Chaetomium globosum CBS 148.51]|uniref:Uncharacterized protein n=1 Tax=Chaetomium globosum (strain ATCC 6205 / CBS 148.51 / DSM 1962 / NBRC 6347 / NRRL 1970) TaxID=306901 RepID=Q2H049_CHAGB|nr:uncharacterized protein CHGG_04847 [Chaetomium globosum CBS 148.51]EAQ88228.1 predicted protein [Chaetomium globosum CBS 148.51]